MSLVTVVIPAYNAAATISDAIDSVLAQTLQDFEIIVSDDGSNDGTAAQVSRYRGESRIRYIKHENRGASHAKNIACRQARGEYLAFLDADDAFEPTALEKMVRKVRATNAAWCVVDVLKKIRNQSVIRTTKIPTGDLLLSILATDFITRSPFYVTSEFLAIGLYDEELSVREDWDVNIRMIHSRKLFAYVNEPLYVYTRTEDSLMTGNLRRILTCTERLLRKHHKKLADLGSKEIARIYAASMWALARQYLYDLHDWREAMRCGRESLRHDMNLYRMIHPLIHRMGAPFGTVRKTT
ncbi:MAG: glycosyl transferase [Candidatus Acidoferrum typicum]|nr:glycosyl transferase [Candidatus Acidoferrum typicum]